ncbi:MAG TPA: hypothetical protein VFE19_11290 [Jatrophihabitantaceae bacterium]|nr:hypothetical protein [Jatrophihabitantaceae bacterium]
MDEERELRALLTRAADTVGVLHPPSFELMAHHQRRQRLAVAILAPACAVILVIAAAIALHVRDNRTPAATIGVSQLTGYRWHSAPAAPLAARSGAATAWTGSELIFWGGQPDSVTKYFDDGAAYDPATKQWTKLPASPLSARGEPISVWAGHDLFIWGGNNRSAHNLTDGALYDPSSQHWTALPTAPLRGDYLDAGAYLVGSKVLLITVPKKAPYSTVDAALYDPAANTWQQESALQLPVHRAIEYLNAVAADGNLLVQFSWQGGTKPRGYSYITTSSKWTQNELVLPYSSVAGRMLWTGSRVLQTPIDRICTKCPPKQPLGLSTDPVTGKRTKISIGPLDRSTPMYVWTGGALLGVARTPPNGFPQAAAQGDAAAWDPATGNWTSLHSATSLKGADSLDARSGLWTGSSLFVWTDSNYPGHLTVLQFGPG